MMTQPITYVSGSDAPAEERLARMEELLWVAQAKAGDADAFARLLSRYEKNLFYFLRKLAPEGEAALDLHQEVWMDVWRGLKSLQAPEAFRVWIYSIARNKAARFRRDEFRGQTLTEALSAAFPEPEINEDPVADAETLHFALASLPIKQGEILTLYYLKDLSTEEIAAVLECPSGTVKSRLHHARLALRRVLENPAL